MAINSDRRAAVLNFLRRQNVAVLATVSKEGQPHASVVFYTINDDLHFYFFTHEQNQKYLNIADNHQLALAVFTEEEPTLVQAEGLARLVTDPRILNEITARLLETAMKSSPWYDPPIGKIRGGKVEVVELSPTWLRFGDFSRTDSNNPFQQIIP